MVIILFLFLFLLLWCSKFVSNSSHMVLTIMGENDVFYKPCFFGPCSGNLVSSKLRMMRIDDNQILNEM